MAILRDDMLIPVGGICLAAALLVDRFVGSGNLVDFLVGLLIGLSIILNLVGLYRRGKNSSN